MNLSTEKQEIEKIATKLSKNPIFNMSLASKELFHSNYLSYLFEQYQDSILKPFMQKFLPDVDSTQNFHKIGREEKNIDLYLHGNQGEDIVIENKFKSIPYESQLEEYKLKFDKHKKTHMILLTLTEPKFSTDWKIIKYNELIDFLKTVNLADSFENQILKKYCEFVSDQLCILSASFQKENFTIKQMMDFYEILNKIRIADIWQKIIFESFLDELNRNKEYRKVDPANIPGLGKYCWTGFSRGTGLVTLANVAQYNNKEDLLLFEIQLQYNKLKFMVRNKEFFKDSSKTQIKNKYSEFFNYGMKFMNNQFKAKYPVRNGLEFKSYNPSVTYIEYELNESLNFNEICEIFKECVLFTEEYIKK